MVFKTGALNHSATLPCVTTSLRAQLVERLYRRTDLLTIFGLWVHILNPVYQGGIFGAQFFYQFVLFQRQFLEFLGVSLLVGLFHFVTELGDIAKGLKLGLVAADYFKDLLRVIPGRLSRGQLLSLRTYGHGAERQNGSNRLQVHDATLHIKCSSV